MDLRLFFCAIYVERERIAMKTEKLNKMATEPVKSCDSYRNWSWNGSVAL